MICKRKYFLGPLLYHLTFLNNPNIFHFLVILLRTAGGFHRGTHKRLLLKDGLEPGLSGPAGSTESQPVSMINNRCFYFLLSIWKK